MNKVVGHCDGHSQFGLGCWVISAVTFYLLLEGRPVDCFALIDVSGGSLVSQLEGLGDGCQRLLNSLSANSMFAASVSTSYPMGIGLDNIELVGLAEAWEEWV